MLVHGNLVSLTGLFLQYHGLNQASFPCDYGGGFCYFRRMGMRLAFKALGSLVGALVCLSLPSLAAAQDQERIGSPWTGDRGVSVTVSELMAREWRKYPGALGQVIRNMEDRPVRDEEEEELDREDRPQYPGAPQVSQWPVRQPRHDVTAGFGIRNPQPYVLGTTFLGGTVGESFAVPPIRWAMSGRLRC